ncbi:Myosin-2 [Hondaea fermentalgiana]|uniref:Myosin-2 n=1 Tax=Hondaea fermentalgiana TaxID=2315210 RepID=A0A2R5GHL4_9STRA|nr:Myosin-2 [Hondaea fermentalgiana]|eukprot:GBG30387.1 Myosin-2 [Hondaea fermentalgiana]
MSIFVAITIILGKLPCVILAQKDSVFRLKPANAAEMATGTGGAAEEEAAAAAEKEKEAVAAETAPEKTPRWWRLSREYVDRRREDHTYEVFTKGTLVWIPDKTLLWTPAKVRETFTSDDEAGRVKTRRNGRTRYVTLSASAIAKVVRMGKESLQCLGHMSVDFRDLSTPALFHNLRLRYDRGFHFMSLGPNVLVFLNFKYETDVLSLATLSDLPDEDDDDEDSAATEDASDETSSFGSGLGELSELCAESFTSLVDRAYRHLWTSKGLRSQTIVVHGLLEAGKRDVAKFILLRVIQLAQPKDAMWWRKLQAADRILHAFGGEEFIRWTDIKILFTKAKTSRGRFFGGWGRRRTRTKADETSDTDANLLGAVYNAFGFSSGSITDRGAESFPAFGMLDDETTREPIREAMATLGMSDAAQDGVEACLRGILEIRSLKFSADVRDDIGDGDSVKSSFSDDPSTILGVSLREMHRALNEKTLVIKGETFRKARPLKDKYAVRDGIARVVYHQLFAYLLALLNNEVAVADKDLDAENIAIEQRDASQGQQAAAMAFSTTHKVSKSNKGLGNVGVIGVLENGTMQADQTSLEELLKNYRLEAFHAYFSKQVAQATADGLKLEGLEVEVPPAYNTGCLELLMSSDSPTSRANFLAYPSGGSRAQDLMHRLSIRGRLSVGRNAAQRTSIKRYSTRRASTKRTSVRRGFPNRSSVSRRKRSAESSFTSRANGSYSSRANGSYASRRTGVSSLGIIQLIEEEVIAPGSSDRGLGNKIARLRPSHKRYLVDAHPLDFQIRHYKGVVSYSIEGFLERIRSNRIPSDVYDLLRECSEIDVLREALSIHSGPAEDIDQAEEFEMRSASAKSNEGIEDRHQGHVESAQTLQREVSRAIGILERTEVYHIACVGTNAACKAGRDFDVRYVSSQTQRMGIIRLITRNVYAGLRGKGIPFQEFLLRYAPCVRPDIMGPIPKSSGPITDMMCQLFKLNGVIRGSYATSPATGAVFVNAQSHYSLETLVSLSKDDAALILSSWARRVLARFEFIRRMHLHIKRTLVKGMDEPSSELMENGIALARKWKLRDNIVNLARQRLLRVEKEDELLASLTEALAKEDGLSVYTLMQECLRIGMTANDFPEVAQALAMLDNVNHYTVTAEDMAEMNRRFAEVALELRLIMNDPTLLLHEDTISDAALSSDEERVNESSEDEYEVDDTASESSEEFIIVNDSSADEYEDVGDYEYDDETSDEEEDDLEDDQLDDQDGYDGDFFDDDLEEESEVGAEVNGASVI